MVKKHVASGSSVRLGSPKRLRANLQAFAALEAQQHVSVGKSGYLLMRESRQGLTGVIKKPSEDSTTRVKGNYFRKLWFLAAPLLVTLIFVGVNPLAEDKSHIHRAKPAYETLARQADETAATCSNVDQARVAFEGVSVTVSNSTCGLRLQTWARAGDLLADRKVTK